MNIIEMMNCELKARNFVHILTYVRSVGLAVSHLIPLTLTDQSFGRLFNSCIVHKKKGGRRTDQLELKVLVGKHQDQHFKHKSVCTKSSLQFTLFL